MEYIVTVNYPGTGKYLGGAYIKSRAFREEKKARDYYTDMLLKYPEYQVDFEKVESR